MTRKPLKLLHTSDLHLGSDIYPADALVGFRQVIALSIEHSVDGVIVAGDLFDNRGVSPELVAELSGLGNPALLAEEYYCPSELYVHDPESPPLNMPTLPPPITEIAAGSSPAPAAYPSPLPRGQWPDPGAY